MDPFENSNKKEVHITLVSDAATADSKNTVYHFKNKLAKPLQNRSNDEWEISLEYINISKKINNQQPPKSFEEREAKIKNELKEMGIKSKTDFKASHIKVFLNKVEKLTKDTRIEIINLKKTYYRDYEAGRINDKKRADFATKLDKKLGDLKTCKYVLHSINDLYVEMTFCKFKDSYSPVFVEIEEVESISSSLDKCVARFDVKPLKTGNSINYIPRKKSWFLLQNKYLSEFSVRILNSDRQTLTGRISDPTAVKLTLRKVNMDEYTYQMINIQSTPGDDPLNFYTRLPEMFRECGSNNDWEVALVKSTVPHRLLNLPTNNRILIAERYQDGGEDKPKQIDSMKSYEIIESIQKSEQNKEYFTKIFDWTLENNPNSYEVIEALTEALENSKTEIEDKNNPYMFRLLRHDNGKLRIVANRRLLLVMPTSLFACMGFQNIIALDNYYSCIELVDSTPEQPDTSPLTQIPPDYNKAADKRYDFKAQYGVDTNILEHQNLLVHLNCIEPSFIGNRFANILAMIPMNKKVSDAYCDYEATHLNYYKLNTNNLSRVNFRLMNTDGSSPSFQYPLMDHGYCYQSNYTLSFRKKK